MSQLILNCVQNLSFPIRRHVLRSLPFFVKEKMMKNITIIVVMMMMMKTPSDGWPARTLQYCSVLSSRNKFLTRQDDKAGRVRMNKGQKRRIEIREKERILRTVNRRT